MARKSETRSINGVSYTVTQLGARQSREVGARIVRILGAGADSDRPVGLALQALRDEDLQFLVDTLAPLTTVNLGDKKPALSDIMEEHFAGQFGAQLKWLAFALEVNFAGFLSEFGIDVAALREAASKAMTVMKGSIGPSGNPSLAAG